VSGGLTAEQVAQRVAQGAVNATPRRTSRSFGQILRANVLTRFNALLGAMCALVLVFGPPIDSLFGWVVVVNSAVGVIQELRAKRTLDRLALVGQAPLRVCRDGREVSVAPDEVVMDDLVLLGRGDKVPVDGQVHDAEGLEIDESLLTGEADPVRKGPGDEVLSGGFVTAGHGSFTATRVGEHAYAARLTAAAGRFDLARSELMMGINGFLRLITWIIIPVGALLVARQFTGGESVNAAVISSVAGVVPMIPEGLVLMTSTAFAIGVIRLGRRNCLVQQLPAVEVLARVDTLCLDKTGTLTEPGMVLRDIRPVDGTGPDTARAALAALARAEPDPNPTVQAIAAGTDGEQPKPDGGWQAQDTLSFSSARKYSGASFGNAGTWLVGAPEVLLAAGDDLRAEADRLAGRGLRVLALARTPDLHNGGQHTAAALVVLEQRLRPDAARTLAYFAEQGVAVKVISGDNAQSVAAIARQVGLPTAGDPVDARSLPEDRDALGDMLDAHAVFGRVTSRS
jgi:cation-transporting ATPase E